MLDWNNGSKSYNAKIDGNLVENQDIILTKLKKRIKIETYKIGRFSRLLFPRKGV